MSKEIVSIIIPVYNAENYLDNCIRSVLNQTYYDIEVILVDDYSIDNSLNICHKYAQNDCRISVIKTKGKGVSATRNTGIEKASGKYICFLDSDDEYEPIYVEQMIQTLKQNKSELVVCGYKEIKGDKVDEIKGVGNIILSVIGYLNDIVSDRNTEDMANYPWNKLYLKSVIDKNNIRFDETISVSEDAVFNMIYLQKVEKVSMIEDLLYRHYIIEGSLVSSEVKADRKKEVLLQIFGEYEKNYKQRNVTDVYADIIGTKLLYYFLRICQEMKGKALKQFIKESQNRKYRKYIRYSQCINFNYKIYKTLYCMKLNLLLYLYSRMKQ